MKYLKLYEDFMEGENLPGGDIPTDVNLEHLVLMEDRGKEKNILIIPGTGEGDAGFASDYNTLAPMLSQDYNVYSCNWPTNFDVESFAKECADDIKKIGGKWVVGGYSFGYRIAYKIAKVFESEKSDLFLNKVFGIDGGVHASEEEEEQALIKANPPRVAVAYTKAAIEKARTGQDIKRDKDFFIFRDDASLNDFLSENKCQTYFGKDEYTPMDLSAIAADFIVENKFPKGEDWTFRYNPPVDDYKDSEGLFFRDEDVRMLREFIERNKGKINDKFTGPLDSKVILVSKSTFVPDVIDKRVSNNIEFETIKDTSIGHDNICSDGAAELSKYLNDFLSVG